MLFRRSWINAVLAVVVSSGTMAQTAERKNLLQAHGPYASTSTFRADLGRYASSWPFYKGRSVELNGSLVFVKKSMTDTQFAKDRSNLSGYSSSTLTRNYVRVLAPAQYTSGNPSATWNLWNDADRDAVVNNFRVLARQAKLLGFKGLFFDPEHYSVYGYNVWQYSNHAAPAWYRNSSGTWINANSFAASQSRMQDLGARVMAAIEAEAPGTRILLTQGLGFLHDLCYDGNGNAVTRVDAAKWSTHQYGLYSSFIAGMASKVYKCRLVDMQENVGYWASSEADLKAGSSFLYDLGARLLLPAAVLPVYRSYIHWGYMLYVDGLFRLTSNRGYISGWMLPSERAAFATTLTYWALKNASGRGCGDADVIIYTEKSMWGTTWGGASVTYPPSQSIPDAFTIGRNHIVNGTTPPNVSTIVTNAWARKRANNWPSS